MAGNSRTHYVCLLCRASIKQGHDGPGGEGGESAAATGPAAAGVVVGLLPGGHTMMFDDPGASAQAVRTASAR